ncbi:developmentally-regulated external PM-anchored protein [Acrasis kona]|uniref:Developmentally-regulated external PM-anchored protein n=1 Tax=Acrasis kona TaxID=1008807 RepID=A0AAW2ZJ27_9EUKA
MSRVVWYLVLQFVTIVVLSVWILFALTLLEEPKKNKFVNCLLNGKQDRGQLYYALCYASYLSTLPDNHPDVIVFDTISANDGDEQASSFLIQCGENMLEEDRVKYLLKGYNPDALKQISTVWIRNFGVSEFENVKTQLNTYLEKKLQGWPESSVIRVNKLVRFVTATDPALLVTFKNRSIVDLLRLWEKTVHDWSWPIFKDEFDT